MVKNLVIIVMLLIFQGCVTKKTDVAPSQAPEVSPTFERSVDSKNINPRATIIRPNKKKGGNEDGRYALVIGNAGYKGSPLKNPVNDAQDMAASLRRLGFFVIEKENRSQKEMTDSIREFGNLIAKGGVGLFYYAGHGMQVNGKNYLIPVNANIQHEDEVAYESVDVDRLLAKMDSAGNRLNIVILDACRNNPFARSFRGSKRGLARLNAPVGTLIAYATSPDSVASDGKSGERNGLYTKYLLANMEIPGVEIGQMFRKVRRAVRIATKKAQIPWESSSMEGDFYFVVAQSHQTTTIVKPPVVKPPKNNPCVPLTDRSPVSCFFNQ